MSRAFLWGPANERDAQTAQSPPSAPLISDFDRAIQIVLAHEGGFVQHPHDPGGATNFGVSLRWLAQQGKLGDYNRDGDVDVADIRALTRPQALALYRTHWWEPYRLGELQDQASATKVLDLMINMGPRQGASLAQQACRRLGRVVLIDGQLGALTRCAINACEPRHYLIELKAIAADFYRLLVARDETRRVFLAGWLARAYS